MPSLLLKFSETEKLHVTEETAGIYTGDKLKKEEYWSVQHVQEVLNRVERWLTGLIGLELLSFWERNVLSQT